MSLINKGQSLSIALGVVIKLLPFIFLGGRLGHLRKDTSEKDTNE